MRYETTPRFEKDWKDLPTGHRAMFTSLVPQFSAACDAFAASPGSFRWPKALRVRRMVSAPGIWEMTWSFDGPDGRATFEFVGSGADQRVRWRRIGGHHI